MKLIENSYTPVVIDNLSNSDISVLDNIKKITGKEIFFLHGDLDRKNEKFDKYFKNNE